jgi:Ca-activated chloride channel family protein
LTVKLRYKLPEEDNSSKIELPVLDKPTEKLSEDFRFAAAVALFGQLLKKSDFVRDANYDRVIELAKPALGKDEQGYRR